MLLGLVFVLVSALHMQYGEAMYSSSCPVPPIPSPIRVISSVQPVFYVANNNSDGTVDYTGMFVDFLAVLAKQGGFDYTLTPRPDLSFGNKLPNGSFDGLVGALVANEADLAGPYITYTEARYEVIDYVVPFTPYYLRVVVNADGINSDTQYLVRNVSYFAYLADSPNATLHAIYENIIAGLPNSIVKTDLDGLDLVRSGNFALITQFPFLNPVLHESENAALSWAPGYLGSFFAGLGVRKDSPLRNYLSSIQLTVAEAGGVDSLLNQYDLTVF